MVSMKADATFYLDVVCPFALIASTRIDAVARSTGATIVWKPILLGGLYGMTGAPQGKAGSASDVPTPAAKKKLESESFRRDLKRYGLDKLKFHPNHPLKSLDAQRLLCAFPPDQRPVLAHRLFHAYWFDNEDVADRQVILRIAKALPQVEATLPFKLNDSVFSDPRWSEELRNNTEEAFERGAFGVPSMYVEKTGKLFWGQDRMHLFEAELLSAKQSKPFSQLQLERLHPRCLRTPPQDRIRHLTFWFDFSSPWSFLGWTQLERLQRTAGPGLKIELKPFLLGALFREIGTPVLPSQALIPVKQAYGLKDTHDWAEYLAAVNAQAKPPYEPINFKYTEHFPIRSVNALRVALLDQKTIPALYHAAWSENKNIADPKVLAKVLTAAGFNGEQLVRDVTSGPSADRVKKQLTANTAEAVQLGLCGAPTYQFEGRLIWGQDKMNIVQDLVLGWNPETSSSLATSSPASSDSKL